MDALSLRSNVISSIKMLSPLTDYSQVDMLGVWYGTTTFDRYVISPEGEKSDNKTQMI